MIELSKGYIENARKRSEEILATLSPAARKVAEMLRQDFEKHFKS
jgi:hypothetical protein